MLFLLTDGLATAPGELIEIQAREYEVEVVDLARPDISYEVVVDKVFDADKVVSW